MKNPLRIVIVGGVAGGASAAAKARRVDENADIQIFERGPYISFANCGLPYFIAGEIDDRAKLIVMTPEKFWERSRVRAHVNHEALSIHRAAKTNEILIPGTPLYEIKDKVSSRTEQHTLAVELRISDVESWRTSERRGDSHHDAYRFRQLIYVMNRIFKNTFLFPAEDFTQLRKDQTAIFP